MASLKVSGKTTEVALSSGTLPNTGFCAEVWTCVGLPEAPAAELKAGEAL
jgi:hypothetical protein